jgi:hypothetical protein
MVSSSFLNDLPVATFITYSPIFCQQLYSIAPPSHPTSHPLILFLPANELSPSISPQPPPSSSAKPTAFLVSSFTFRRHNTLCELLREVVKGEGRKEGKWEEAINDYGQPGMMGLGGK